MPPSPALRCSPGREHGMENTHRRGRSFDNRLMLKAKEDDLALFNEMKNRERENFLLQISDDFDDSISKLRHCSDFKLNINIPAQGESSDLLNADDDKNDYDWLLTPPDTPLFPSLDDDEPQEVKLGPRGRPRGQPISISRSSIGEKAHRTSRSSASPHRLSSSPQSSHSTVQSRVRSSSAPCSSSHPVLRSTTPSRRPSTPPTKLSTPTPRSSTPTLRRMSTGSSGQALYAGTRGTSPIRASRGNSASPKLRGWQSNLSGFSTDTPPNLRTSISDRSTSRVRGLSPASGNGRDLSSKFRRQSISPSASRSTSLSQSHEQDCLSSYSNASSGKDDVNSVRSVAGGIYGNSIARKNGALVNSRDVAFSKKPSRILSASSAPKRYLDYAFRPMDHQKTPQNMFRPLLSSVPTTTFYLGKVNSMHRPLFSRNSSLTTSSNASSELGASVAPDMEDSDHEQGDLAGDSKRTQDHNTQEEIFIFDKVDEIDEDTGHDIDACKLQSSNENFDERMANENFDEATTNKIESHELENSMSDVGVAASFEAASHASNSANEHSEVDRRGVTAICSNCGRCFHVLEVHGDMDVCEECAAKERNCNEVMLSQHGRNSEQEPDFLPDGSPFLSAKVQNEQDLSQLQTNSHNQVSIPEPDDRNKSQQSQATSHPSLRVDNPEGTGISVLLQRSGSSKWPVVQGRAFSATNILCSEPSYVRDSLVAMKHSIGRDSASASSSADLGSSRHMEVRVQRQLSSRKVAMDNVRSDCNSSTRSIGSHSDISVNAFEALVLPKSETGTVFDSFVGGFMENVVQQHILFATKECDNSSKDSEPSAIGHSSIGQAVVDGDPSVCADSCMAFSASDTQLSSQPWSINVHETSSADNLNEEECTSSNSADSVLLQNNESIQDAEVVIITADSTICVEDHMPDDTTCRDDISDTATGSSSVVAIGQQNDHNNSQGSQSECTPFQMSSNMEDVHEGCISTTSDKDVLISASESNIAEHPCCIHEEPTVMIEGRNRQMPRSLTLEEATDAILFCSSIIHDLAYKAAAIGIEKELVLHEVPRPTVTILGKSAPDRKDSRKMSNKHSPNLRKVKRKKLETEFKLPSGELGNNLKNSESTPADAKIPNTVDCVKPPKLESKCNCTVM